MKCFFNFLLIILLISCKDTENANIKKMYFPSKNLKYEVGISNGRYEGRYMEYYENGNLKVEGNYTNGFKNGLFTYYHDKGKLLKEVREYIIVKNSSYLNQRWLFNKKGDTLKKSNYYTLMTKNTLKKDKQVLHIYLEEPFFSYDSELFFCIPRKEGILKNDFSNQNAIEWDTILSLSNWFKNQNKYRDRNHDIIFDLDYETTGKKRLRGILVEKMIKPKKDTSDYDFVTRNIYFDKEFFIENGNDGL